MQIDASVKVVPGNFAPTYQIVMIEVDGVQMVLQMPAHHYRMYSVRNGVDIELAEGRNEAMAVLYSEIARRINNGN